jgi:NhaP-type Na+/H+ or K+/H+ antiporter
VPKLLRTHSLRPALALLAGFALGTGGAGLFDFDPGSHLIEALALFTLALILFRDGLEVEDEMLRRAWHVPALKLAVAMPLTAVLVAAAAKLLLGGFSWTEALLLGALLSPTDPVLTASVVTNPRVPRLVRHSLNLESGMNDGLALPAVLAFAGALAVDEKHFVWWKFVLQDVSVGLLVGVAMGLLAARLVPRENVRLAFLAAAATYGVAAAPPHGNALIAVFTCAIVLGVRRHDIAHGFGPASDGLAEVVKLAIFAVFGSLLSLHLLFADRWAAAGIVAFALLGARMIAVFASLAGTGVDAATTAFMGWFGPKGVATMTFSLLVLAKHIPHNERIFGIAALAVCASVIAHGLSDGPGAEWIARRGEPAAAGATEGD